MTPAELTAAREAAQLKPVRLAEMAGISRHDLNKLERGKRTIGPGMAARLREALTRAEAAKQERE